MISRFLRHFGMETHQPELSEVVETLKRQQQMSAEGGNSLNTPLRKGSVKSLMKTSSQSNFDYTKCVYTGI